MSKIRFEQDRNWSLNRFNRIAFFSEPHQIGKRPRWIQNDAPRRPDLKLRSIDLINMLRFLETVTHEGDITESEVQAFLAENDPAGGAASGEFRIEAETNDFFDQCEPQW